MKFTESAPRHFLLAAWAVLLGLAAFLVFSRNADFAYYYHPDEPGKVEQIVDGKWNFHHPMLMLSTSRVAWEVSGKPTDPQTVVELGRRVSAAFMAIAVVALSILAFLFRGWLAAISAGVALVLHHQLYELAHYFKEDASLLMGFALTLLCLLAYAQSPTLLRAALLGVACALAVSAKYVGVVAFAMAAPVLIARQSSGSRAWLRAVLYLAGALITLLVINAPILADLQIFRQSFNRELELAVEGQGDSTRSVPHALYWNVFLDNTNPVIWVLMAAFFVSRWKRRAQLSIAEWIIVIFPFAFAIALSCSPKENDRYFLPATALLTLLAALGVQDMPYFLFKLAGVFGFQRPERFVEPRVRVRSMSAAAILLCVVQCTGWSPTKPGLFGYDHAFQRDDFRDLLTWMSSNLPPSAVVAADARTGLPNPERKKHAERAAQIPQRLLVSRFAADFGTLDELKKQGVTHVAISESSYGRFFRGDLRAKEGGDEKFRKAKTFYEQLLREGEGELVFDRERGTVIYLHPGIRVYRIRP